MVGPIDAMMVSVADGLWADLEVYGFGVDHPTRAARDKAR
jgi:hypothetical protein